MKKIIFLFMLIPIFVYSQIGDDINAERLVDWQYAGYPGSRPAIEQKINVKNLSSYDPNDLLPALNQAVNISDESILTEIYVPEGTYIVSGTFNINKSNIVVRGDGPAKTKLIFTNTAGYSIYISDGVTTEDLYFNNPKWTQIISGLQKGSNTLGVVNTAGFSPGTYAEISQENGSWFDGLSGDDASEVYYHTVGQIVKIAEVGTNLILDETDKLRINFAESGAPAYDTRIRPIKMIENVGLENIYIKQNSVRTSEGHSIVFHYAAKCWLDGVESFKTTRSHVLFSASTECEVKGSYFHDSYNFGDGGFGYGVICVRHSGKILIENNIFDTLRHAMLVQHGANGNVFAYNFSFNAKSYAGEFIGPIYYKNSDISLHGHYPFSNLFEGNIAQYIYSDHSHGANGPYNTFLRNRLIDCADFGENSPNPFAIQYYLDNPLYYNIVNNFFDEPIVEMAIEDYAFGENRNCNAWQKFLYSEGQLDTLYNIIQVKLIKNSDDMSYYRKSKPPFFSSYNWPFDPNTNSLPAYDRWFANADAIMRYSINSKRYLTIKNIDETGANLGGTISFEDQNLQNKNYKTSKSNGLMPLEKWAPKVNIQTNKPELSGKKHHDWQNIDQLFLLKNDNYQPQAEQNNIFANFKSQSSTTITSNIGKMPFIHDPWYVSDTINLVQPNTFIQITASGSYDVFLMQGGIDVKNLDFPYYSLKTTPKDTIPAHGVDVLYNFVEWTGNNVDFKYPNNTETAVLFKKNGATVKAVYKGHLISSVARATGYNNGRRIAKDGSGTLHLVYEDDNKIWYTYSTDNGQHWNKEEKISDLAGNPSVAISNGLPGEGVHVHVVWETPAINQDEEEIHYISYSIRTTSGWSDPIPLSEGEYSPLGYWTGPDSRRPSIYAEGSDELFVTWNSAGQLKIINHNSYGQWSNVTNIPNAYNGYPDIVLTPTGTQRLRIVWADNGHIKYIGGSYSGNNNWSWTAVYTISNNTPPFFHNHNNPSVTVSGNDHFHVAWECEDDIELSKKILYQEYGASSTPQTVGSLYSIASHDLGNIVRNVSIGSNIAGTINFHYEYLGKIYNKLKTGGSWSTYNRGTGKYPNCIFNDIQKGVWTTYSSAPYLLKTENLNGWLAKSAIAEVASFKRFYYSRSDSGYFTVDLKEFTANGQKLTFYQNLNSDTIEVNDLTDFDYQLEMGENIEAGDLLSFWFVTDEQKYFLDQVQLDGDEAQTVIERSLSFDPGQPVQGYVQIEFSDNAPFAINVVPDNGNGSLAKNVTLRSASFVPQTFSLKQNFPNPFNPVTQIQFDLPQAAKVTLKVFDLSGHEVATLVNGFRSAGRYQVVFDGRNLASGVYIYQLTTDKGFRQSRKMMLIK